MNTAFLFGSGLSIPAGYPSTTEITDNILSAKNIIHHTDQSYYYAPDFPKDEIGMYHETITEVCGFLEILKKEINYYYKNLNGKIINYEDIYFLVSELYNNELGEIENPAISFYKEHLNPLIEPLLMVGDKISKHKITASELFNKTVIYIKSVVSQLLSINSSDLKHLMFLKDIIRDKLIDKTFIFTLNHDTLLENYFLQQNIAFSDGFTKPVNNMRYWEPTTYQNENNKLLLFKIHGSINWHNFREDGGGWYTDKIGIATDGNIYHNTSKNGKTQTTHDYHPRVLIGTYNKLQEYTSGIFLDLLLLFYQYLERTDKLIICGYSFGDKVINSRILDWVYKKRERRIVIINKDLEKLKRIARGAISNKIDLWLKDNILKVIPKYIQETNWDEIKENLLH